MKNGLQVVMFLIKWIQFENLRNVVHEGAEGWSLQWGSQSFLLVVVGKSDQGVGAPFRWVLVNEIRGLELPSSSGWRMREGCSLSAGGCLRAGMSMYQYKILSSFLYNKYWRQRLQQWWFSLELGFHLKSWCSCVFFMCDDILCSYYTCLLLTKHLMNEWCTNLSK